MLRNLDFTKSKFSEFQLKTQNKYTTSYLYIDLKKNYKFFHKKIRYKILTKKLRYKILRNNVNN